ATAQIARLGEPLQVDTELLARLAEAGVLPGAVVAVERVDALVSLAAPGSALVLDLPEEIARHVFVRAAAPQ
ncbi:MAG: ferrous iron transport protein A, partial [Actinobacteria bacterium]|nr:ferrous iron transport protein A [Actinomycetota bacterium]